MSPQPIDQPIKALAFDAYGTLFDVFSVQALTEELFPTKGQQLTQIWRQKQLQYTWLVSLMGRYEDFWQITRRALIYGCKSLDLNDEPVIDRLMNAYLRLQIYPEVAEGLQRLSQQIPLAILSNGSPMMLEGAVNHAGIEGYLKHVLSADAVGIYKPKPAIYQLALDAFGESDPAAIGFVSSNAWDVTGATSFGFTSFWINRSGQPEEELEYRAIRIVSLLTDLIEVIPSFRS